MKQEYDRPRRTDMTRATLIAVYFVSILAVAASGILNYWRPELFSWPAILPATFTYFGAFAALFRFLRMFPERRLPRGAPSGAEAVNTKPSAISNWMAELLFGVAFTAAGVIAGALSGTVWWIAGGHELRTLFEALKIGSILGGAVIAMLLGA
jgi:hypothetical protein